MSLDWIGFFRPLGLLGGGTGEEVLNENFGCLGAAEETGLLERGGDGDKSFFSVVLFPLRKQSAQNRGKKPRRKLSFFERNFEINIPLL